MTFGFPKLDRLPPPDFDHVAKYPLSAHPNAPVGVPVIGGFNWYHEFDVPEQLVGPDGVTEWWVARGGASVLTSVRGGHCFCIKATEPDRDNWWDFYNQGQEGACVGFGTSRCLSELLKSEFDAFELYHATQEQGGYVGQEGAFVRDALEVLRLRGALVQGQTNPDQRSKISSYHWAVSADEVLSTIAMARARQIGAVPFVNSWGRVYPHVTWMPAEVLDRLIHEQGEVAVITF